MNSSGMMRVEVAVIFHVNVEEWADAYGCDSQDEARKQILNDAQGWGHATFNDTSKWEGVARGVVSHATEVTEETVRDEAKATVAHAQSEGWTSVRFSDACGVTISVDDLRGLLLEAQRD